jgi:membrane-associated phospholipid phosphatase
MARLGFMFGVGAALLVAATPAAAAEAKVAAEEHHALEWKPTWTRFRTVEYVATPVIGGVTLYRLLFAKGPDHPRWAGPILVDGEVRDAMRVRSSRALANVRLAGDIATIAPVVHVLLIDSLLVPAIDGNTDVAWQMTAMNAEAFAVSGLVVGALFDIVARARPSYEECTAGTTDDNLCNSGKYADFPSGHTATAFTAAGLTCAHHANLPLYGGGAPDVLACVASLGIATSVGVFRLVGDRHYLSDVVVGGGIGFMFGFGLPMLLHYREHPVNEVYSSAAIKIGVSPGSDRAPLGASAFGLF